MYKLIEICRITDYATNSTLATSVLITILLTLTTGSVVIFCLLFSGVVPNFFSFQALYPTKKMRFPTQ